MTAVNVPIPRACAAQSRGHILMASCKGNTAHLHLDGAPPVVWNQECFRLVQKMSGT